MSFYEPEISAEAASQQPAEIISLRKKLSGWCKVKSPRAEIMIIAPDLAMLMLERNPDHNRQKNNNVVAQYRREIEENHMMLTNQGIGFDTNGKLVDGQHRLMACVSSGHSFESVVVFGLDPETFMFVDSGYKRTPGQKVAMAGFSQGNQLAAAARTVLVYDLCEIVLNPEQRNIGLTIKGERGMRGIVPAEFIVDFCRENPKFVEMTSWYSTYDRFRPISRTLFHAAHWIIKQKHPKLADAFIEQLALGESLNRKENVYRLRDALSGYRFQNIRIPTGWVLCWIIDAFNDTRRGKITEFKMVKGRDFPKVMS